MNALWKLRNGLLADRRKLGVMLTLALVAMLLWGRLLMKNVPRTAVADPQAAIAAIAPGTPAAASAKTADKPRPASVIVPRYPPVRRDLFAFDPLFYGVVEKPEATGPVQAKSSDDPSDEEKERQQRRLAVRAAAKQLTLQSTLLGTVNRAMINCVLLEPGQMILGFELTDVRSRQVTLVRDGIEVKLEM